MTDSAQNDALPQYLSFTTSLTDMPGTRIALQKTATVLFALISQKGVPMYQSLTRSRLAVRIATLAVWTLWHPGLSWAQDVDLTTETLVGVSMADDLEQGACTLTISKNKDGNIVRMTVSGMAKRKTAGLPNQPMLASSSISVGNEPDSEGWWSFSNFSPLPSVAHLGYMRVALQMRWSNFENPWPGIQEVKYIVQKGGYDKLIAHSDIYFVPSPKAMGYDHMECVNLVRDLGVTN